MMKRKKAAGSDEMLTSLKKFWMDKVREMMKFTTAVKYREISITFVTLRKKPDTNEC